MNMQKDKHVLYRGHLMNTHRNKYVLDRSHLMTMHKDKHELYGYFPENRRL